MSMHVEGLERLKAKLWAIKRNLNDPDNTTVTGFTQRYALKVHEDLQMRHDEGKQAKYLEAPARQYADVLREIVIVTFKRTHKLSEAMLLAGLRLQREAQKIVPIDTSALKASAFTCYQDDLDATSSVAFIRSEAVRLAELEKRGFKKLKKSMRKASSRAKKMAKQENMKERNRIKRQAKRKR